MNLCLPCVCLIPTSLLLPALWCSVLLDAGVSNCLLSRLPDCPPVCLPAFLQVCSSACFLSVCLSIFCLLPAALSACLFAYLLAYHSSTSVNCWPSLFQILTTWTLSIVYFVFFFVYIISVSSLQFLLRSMMLTRDQVSIFDNWGMCIPYVPWTCFGVLAPSAVNCPNLGVFYLVQRTACHWGDTEGLVMLCVWQSQSYSCGVLASWWIPEESHPGAKNVSSGRSSWVSHVALGGGRLEPF